MSGPMSNSPRTNAPSLLAAVAFAILAFACDRADSSIEASPTIASNVPAIREADPPPASVPTPPKQTPPAAAPSAPSGGSAPTSPTPTVPPSTPGGRVPGSAAGFGGSGTTAGGDPPAREGELPRSPAGLPMMPIDVKGQRFLMELALDEPTRQRGLGGRRSLANDRGMLFAHPKPEILGYWMKDCFMDIDIAYVDAVGKVTAVYRMKKEPPRKPGESLFDYHRRLPSYSSRRSAVLVLEFAPGTLDRLDLRMGEQLDLDVTKLRGMSSE
jgi:uncharacterized membrane protein (UPF0127 family)